MRTGEHTVTQFRARLIADLMLNDAFAGRPMSEAVARHLYSKAVRSAGGKLECSYSWHRTEVGSLRFSCTTVARGLNRTVPMTHRYAFPLRGEVRESGVVLGPDNPRGSSEITLAPEDVRSRGYFFVGVHDVERRLLSCDTLTYDRDGRIEPYVPVVRDKFISPLRVAEGSLGEAVDDEGHPVLRLRLSFDGMTEIHAINVGYNSLVGCAVHTRVVSPDRPLLVSDLPLVDHPWLLPGELIVGVTDLADRMVVNGIVWVEAPGD
jgi:hypothetical protein